jgi:1,4-dihydroxy-2-naphthoyl-CoA hydrolase
MDLLSRDGPNLMTTLGIRIVSASPDETVLEMDFKPEMQQLTGLFHTGAILALADSAATQGSMRVVDPEKDTDAARFPLAVQLSASLVRNTNSGTLTATARPVHRGRTMIVMETEVRDSGGRLLTTMTSTHLVLG